MARQSLIDVYFNRRMAALLGLGFASGLPSAYALLGQSMQAWLGAFDVDVKTIGLFSLISIPFAFNFVWAPLLDRYTPPVFRQLGRRRGWMLIIQIVLVAAIVVLALAGPTQGGANLQVFAIVGLVVAVLAATQDVVNDAYRADVLPNEELGAGAALFVNGYRVAMLAAGGGAMLLSEVMPWRGVYLVMAALMGVGIISTLIAPTPDDHGAAPATLREAIVEPVRDFFGRYLWIGAAVLAFAVLFKLPDSLARVMITPMLQTHLKFDMAQIAWVSATLGPIMTVIGALAGGVVVAKLGVVRSLWVLGVLQMVSNFGYAALAVAGKSVPMLAVVVSIENFCGGMVTAGFIAFLMSLCNRRYSATQYALFTSLNYFTATIVGATSGFAVSAIGYGWFFVLTVFTGLPGLALLAWVGRSLSRPDMD